MHGQATEIWTHEFTRRFEALPADVRRRIIVDVRDLGRRLESFPHSRMQGFKCFRLRVGDYRILYSFDVGEHTLELISVGHRREVYR